MARRDYARLEALPDPAYPGVMDVNAERPLPRRGRRRVLIFIAIFLCSAAVGLAYTFIRPAVYETTATLLIAPPAGFEQEGADSSRYIAVQREVLTGQALLKALRQRLPAGVFADLAPTATASLRDLLSTQVTADSDLLELRVVGVNPELLPVVMGAWIELYLQTQTEDSQAARSAKAGALREQLGQLEQRVATKREDLARFRETHEIVSLERDENQVLARLRALNEALNKAHEEVVAASAEYNAAKQALSTGALLGQADDRVLAEFESRAANLRERLKTLERRFTPAYMALDPDIVAMTQLLEQLEEKIRVRQQEFQSTILSTTERALSSAREREAKLQTQLDVHQGNARQFTTRFAEYSALIEELEQLELSYREARDGLLQTEVAEPHRAPRAKVLDQPYVPSRPLYPDYRRDAALSLGAAVLLGLAGVLLYDFFTRPARQAVGPQPWPVFYPVSEPRLVHPAETAMPSLPPGSPVPALAHPQPERELTVAEVRTLFDAADADGRLLLGLLLSGLTVEEAAGLYWEDVVVAAGSVEISGPSPRLLSLGGPVRAMLEQRSPAKANLGPVLRDARGRPLSAGLLKALLQRLAHDAGLDNPAAITPVLVRRTHLGFLLRQGIRLDELTRIAGHIPPEELLAHSAYSAAPEKPSPERIEFVYPGLRPQSEH